MTPEQESKFERMLENMSGRVARLENSVLHRVGKLEESNRVLAESVISLRETVRADADVRFEVLQNMHENLRTELLDGVREAKTYLGERLDGLKSDVHNIARSLGFHDERIDSVFGMATNVHAKLERLAQGVIGVYDGGSAARVEENDIEIERSHSQVPR